MLYLRLYINRNTKQIFLCEQDTMPIRTEPLLIQKAPQDMNLDNYKDMEPQLVDDDQHVIVNIEVENLRGDDHMIDAGEFVDTDMHGSSVFSVQDDFSVKLCPKKCKNNKGLIKDIKYLRIRNVDVMR